MKLTPLTHAIVLTGGIASGKSTALAIFQKLGYEHIDADIIAHQLLNRQKDKVKKIWGESYLLGNTVNRSKLGHLIFNNPNERQKLENLLHPLIRQEIYTQAQALEQKGNIYFIDIPLFFEHPNQYPINTSVLIYCSKEKQKKRLIKRNQLNEQEAEIRINSQLDIEEKRKKTTFIIDNSGSPQQLTTNCTLFLQQLA